MKVHRRQGDVLVAACDTELVDTEIDNEGSVFAVNGSFYGEEEADREDLVLALEEATIVNVLGERAVACAVEVGIVDEGSVTEVGRVPHAQMVVIT